MASLRASGIAVLAVAALGAAAACSSTTSSVRPDVAITSSATSGLPSELPSKVPSKLRSSPATKRVPPTRRHARPTPEPRPPNPSPTGGPVIVVDPGHSPSISATDPATGLDVSDYENEPEMRDVFAVAELVKAKLQAAGYRVVMTKASAYSRVSLGERAAIANAAHAALALSIHDQAGSDGGIGFDEGNNIVYYQSVGTYRATSSGMRVYFTDQQLADTSERYGQIFRDERARVEGHSVALQGDVGYDLGTRGLAPGDIWLVQLLARVPWIYNEAGGNSAGMSGLNTADEQRYADGLVAGVEHCVPPR